MRSTTSALVDALAVASRDAIGGGEPDLVDGPVGPEQVALLPVTVEADAVVIVPDSEMLSDPATVWPVYIDPGAGGSASDWTAIRDVFGPDYRFNPDQGVGKCDRATSSSCEATFRSRLKYRFTGLSDVGGVQPSDIVKATFAVVGTHSYDCTPRPVNVYRTDDFNSGSTWPGGSWIFQSQLTIAHKPGCASSPARRIEFVVKEAAQALAGTGGSSLALGIVAGDESSMSGWKRYGYDATLSITYNQAPNAPSAVKFVEPAASCKTGSGRPAVRVTNPTISGVFADPDKQAVQANVAVVKIPTPTWKTSLAAGERLRPGESLRSPDGRTYFTLQGDGNLVIYDPAKNAIWNAGTQGQGGTSLVLQGDGNLVLYTASGGVVWHLGTYGSGAARLNMQDDGNLVLYTATAGVVWFSNTASVAPAFVWTGVTQAQISGASHQVTVTNLKDGQAYRVHMNGIDSDGRAGPVVTCEVRVDLSAPPAPTVTPVGPGPIYTSDTLAGGPGQTGYFQFGPGGATDIVRYEYSFQTSVFDKATPVGAPTIQYTPKSAGPYTLYYRSVDAAGNPSPPKTYGFSVGYPETITWSLDEASGLQSAGVGGADSQPLSLSASVTRAGGAFAGVSPGDRALVFDSAADTAVADGPVVETIGDFTVAAIVKADAATEPRVIASQDGASTSAFELGTHSCGAAGGFCWSFSMAGSDAASAPRTAAVSDVAVQPGKWTLVVGVYDSVQDSVGLWVCTIGSELGDLDPRQAPDVPFAGAWAARGRFRVGAGASGSWLGSVGQVRVVRDAAMELADVRTMCNQPAE